MAKAEGQDIIVIGGSAGAIEALSEIVAVLPANLPAAVAVVVHHYDRSPSVLGKILDRRGPLPAVTVETEMPFEQGRIHVPRHDRHLVVEPGLVRARPGPKHNRARPSVDRLFGSAAAVFGPRVVGVLLSGNLDDGTAGLAAIKAAGGLTVVQDPDEAMFPGMPASALEVTEVDHRLRVAEIGPLLTRAAEGKMATPSPVRGGAGSEEIRKALVPVVCPICHGALQEIDDGKLISFACHTGHTFGVSSLLASQDDDIEIALWSAVRVLEEKIFFLDRLYDRAEAHGSFHMGERHRHQRGRLEHHVATLRRLLEAD